MLHQSQRVTEEAHEHLGGGGGGQDGAQMDELDGWHTDGWSVVDSNFAGWDSMGAS